MAVLWLNDFEVCFYAEFFADPNGMKNQVVNEVCTIYEEKIYAGSSCINDVRTGHGIRGYSQQVRRSSREVGPAHRRHLPPSVGNAFLYQLQNKTIV
jgi:hypothetical protein